MTHFIEEITRISKKYEKQINKSMLPLKQLGITYLAIQKVTSEGYWNIISSNPEWIEYSADNQFFLYDPSLINPKHYTSGISFVNSHDHDDFRNIFCKHSEGIWDLGNALVIVEKKGTECEFTFLATSVNNKKIINTYITKLNLLRQFKEYFKKENANIFHKTAEYNVDLKQINKSYFSEDNIIDLAIESNDVVSLNNNFFFQLLSAREQECVRYFLQGKTAKETAYLLNLSYRTIEEYFTNIKKKLHCRNKRDLIDLFIAQPCARHAV